MKKPTHLSLGIFSFPLGDVCSWFNIVCRRSACMQNLAFTRELLLQRPQGGNSAALWFPLNFPAHCSSAPLQRSPATSLQQKKKFSHITLPMAVLNIKCHKMIRSTGLQHVR
jgi:hypothetical protein